MPCFLLNSTWSMKYGANAPIAEPPERTFWISSRASRASSARTDQQRRLRSHAGQSLSVCVSLSLPLSLPLPLSLSANLHQPLSLG